MLKKAQQQAVRWKAPLRGCQRQQGTVLQDLLLLQAATVWQPCAWSCLCACKF